VTVSVGGDGQPEADVVVSPAGWADWRAWAGEYGIALPARDDTIYLSDPDTTLWWRSLPPSGTLYIRYQRVTYVASGDASAITDIAADAATTRVVLDLRQNPGGDNHTSAPLFGVLQQAAANRPGSLYVMTDRLTFSAAAILATQFEQKTDALFAGEAPGGGLNFWDDVKWVDLPHYPMTPRVGVSTRYWQFAAPDDPRLTIEPDIAVPVRASDYFAGRDPTLEAVLLR
jgi:C-terminal processing protease CtpA/Prc